jgi:hypothetical protein
MQSVPERVPEGHEYETVAVVVFVVTQDVPESVAPEGHVYPLNVAVVGGGKQVVGVY